MTCLLILPLLWQHSGTVFQQDNTQPQQAHVYELPCHVEIFPWQAQSHDFYIIEHETELDFHGRCCRKFCSPGLMTVFYFSEIFLMFHHHLCVASYGVFLPAFFNTSVGRKGEGEGNQTLTSRITSSLKRVFYLLVAGLLLFWLPVLLGLSS